MLDFAQECSAGTLNEVGCLYRLHILSSLLWVKSIALLLEKHLIDEDFAIWLHCTALTKDDFPIRVAVVELDSFN